MSGFIRRFTTPQGAEVYNQIEGAVIIDLPPPGAVNGVGTGVVGMVGEFADMALAIAASSGGVISTKIQPGEIFSAQDLADKFGGFDPTLGDHGNSLGSGFLALRNKRFSRLVLAAVNLCSAQGARFWRVLPLCRTTTDATPAVPVSGAQIVAGREFRAAGVGRIKIGTRVNFTARLPITTGVGGATVAGGSAVTQVFNSTGGFDWTLIDRGDGTLGARKGDILVIGNNNAGAVQPTAEAGTYRVASDPVSGIAITLQRLDGAAFVFTAQTTIPWRLHHSTDADSARERVVGSSAPGGYVFADAGGAHTPVRPITNAAGAGTDGTYTAATLVVPAVVPPALTGSTADPLSGLAGSLHPVTATTFTAAVQLSNAVSASGLDAVYSTAFDAFLGAQAPVRDVNILAAARKSSAIRTAGKNTAANRAQQGKGMDFVTSPQLSVVTTTAATADADPGVGANRSERVFYSWPGAQHNVPEAVGYLIGTSDGDFTDSGLLDDSGDLWLASILSNLAPERNPGQSQEPVPTLLGAIVGLQRGLNNLQMADYVVMRQQGIAGLRIDPNDGPVFQSGITTSLVSGQKNIARRRMADFIEDSVAARLNQLAKLPLTEDLKDTCLTEVVAFMDELKSPNNPKAQRINDYSVDGVSGNTANLESKGIFVLIGNVRTLATADTIVFQAQIGEGVVIVSAN